MKKSFTLGRVMMALEILENYDWDEMPAVSKSVCVIREYVESEIKAENQLRVAECDCRGGCTSGPLDTKGSAVDGIFSTEVQAELEKTKTELKKSDAELQAICEKSVDKAIATVDKVIDKALAGRNGLGKAAMERVMMLPANAICAHFTRPSRRVEKTFAEHFGWLTEVAE